MTVQRGSQWCQQQHQRRPRHQARLRVMVKRILKKHGYPPYEREKATRTVLEQALLADLWAA
jgi:type I restriction enzyme, R subunit